MLKHKSEPFSQFKKFKILAEAKKGQSSGAIGLKLIFKLKKNAQGEVLRHKVYGAPYFKTSHSDQASSKVPKRYNSLWFSL
ncbi:unnamed protein product [Spirodela intermedia]|uniref:Uncharacterized protein n=1 Tax=Spirodela intermedia TaxID=51605 RepID=A0A7I8JAF6_SPIIN|nr:unnamed protein product [Spirodela intermedia]CAA6666423.1 unnamed protein product [Spirodela intermedia]